jgi:hypothetical protein
MRGKARQRVIRQLAAARAFFRAGGRSTLRNGRNGNQLTVNTNPNGARQLNRFPGVRAARGASTY